MKRTQRYLLRPSGLELAGERIERQSHAWGSLSGPLDICCSGWYRRLVHGVRCREVQDWEFSSHRSASWVEVGLTWPCKLMSLPEVWTWVCCVQSFLLKRRQHRDSEKSVPRADLNSGATLAAYKIYVLPFSFNSQFSFSQKIKRRKWLEETVENEKSFIFQNILFVLQKPANLHMVQLPCPRFIAIVRLCPWRGKSSRPFLHIMQVFGNFIPFQSFIRHLGGVVGLFSVFSIVIQIKKFWESALDYMLLLLSHVSRVRLCVTP